MVPAAKDAKGDGGGGKAVKKGQMKPKKKTKKAKPKKMPLSKSLKQRVPSPPEFTHPKLPAALVEGVQFVGEPCTYTLSVALPTSILVNAQTPEKQAQLVGQIGRIMTIFGVQELVVYEDIAANMIDDKGGACDEGKFSKWMAFFVRNLQYLETPQYLRKALFPIHKDLRFAGLQTPLDAPHHVRTASWSPFREGVALSSDAVRFPFKEKEKEAQKRKIKKQKKTKKGGREESEEEAELEDGEGGEKEKKKKKKKKKKDEHQEEEEQEEEEETSPEGTYVDCGLPREVWVPESIPPGVRVTVKFGESALPFFQTGTRQTREKSEAAALSRLKGADCCLEGEAVGPSEPLESAGMYWGYRVRPALSLKAALNEGPYSEDGGYDLLVGTSERGDAVSRKTKLPHFRHMLIVFGGPGGLEDVLADEQCGYQAKEIPSDPRKLFHLYLNTVPRQCSRTIRTEEALLASLSVLNPLLVRVQNVSTMAATSTAGGEVGGE